MDFTHLDAHNILPSLLPAHQSHLSTTTPPSPRRQQQQQQHGHARSASTLTPSTVNRVTTALLLPGRSNSNPTNPSSSTLISNNNNNSPHHFSHSLSPFHSTTTTRSKSKGKVLAAAAGERRRAVFCDVVLDGLEIGEDDNFVTPSIINSFITKLGTRIEPTPHSGKPRVVRPATPSKPRRVSTKEVKNALREMAQTEMNYGIKIEALWRDYALPLRRYAKMVTTAIIPPFEARHLFANLEEIVAISESFAKDLKEGVLDILEGGALGEEELPQGFGEMVLSHIQKMTPFKKYLSSFTQIERIYASLAASNTAFVHFVERQEKITGKGGLKDLLAEPFQRISRYGLMIDPIIRHLADDDPNLPPLETASELLVDICSMEEDEEVSKAAAMWGLKETIENFPHSMISSSRSFLSCLDVDEVLSPSSSSSSSSTPLRCTLFLFSDKLMIAKRPAGDRTGRQLAGLDNLENLGLLYSGSSAAAISFGHSSTGGAGAGAGGGGGGGVYTLPGSPKKLKKSTMGFRGEVHLTRVLAVDLGGIELGLVLEEGALRGEEQGSERWHGRRTSRRYVVAKTYPEDIRRAEKTVFLGMVATTKCLLKASKGFVVIKGNSTNDEGQGNGGDSTRIYWSICVRRSWEDGEARLRGPLALHFDASGTSSQLEFGAAGDPSVIARANLLADNTCAFSVRSHDREPNHEVETISLDRIIAAISEISATYNLFTFPSHSTSTSSSSSHDRSHASPLVSRPLSRPKSLLLSACDVFGVGSGGSGSSGSVSALLKRGQSGTSRGSAMTGTTTTTTTATGTSLFSRYSNSNSHSNSDDQRSQVRESRVVKRPVPVWDGDDDDDAVDRRRRAGGGGSALHATTSLRGVKSAGALRTRKYDTSSRGGGAEEDLRRRDNAVAMEAAEEDMQEEDDMDSYDERHYRHSSLPPPVQPLFFGSRPSSVSISRPISLESPAVLKSRQNEAEEEDTNSYDFIDEFMKPALSPLLPLLHSPAPLRLPSRDLASASSSRPASTIAARTGAGSSAPRTMLKGPRALPTSIPPSPISSLNKRRIDHDAEQEQEREQARERERISESTMESRTSRDEFDDEEKVVGVVREREREDRSPAKKKSLVVDLSAGGRGGGVSSPRRDASPINPRSATNRRIVSGGAGGSASAARRSRRVAVASSPTSTALMMKKDSVLPEVPPNEVEMKDDTQRPTKDRLQAHVTELRSFLSRGIANKENERVGGGGAGGTIGGMSRSPKTTNVHLKLTAASSPPPFSSTAHLDLPALIRWIEGMDRLIGETDSTVERSSVDTAASSSAAMEGLRMENERLVKQYAQAQTEIATLKSRNDLLQLTYDEMSTSAEDLYKNFDIELDEIFQAVNGLALPASSVTLMQTTQAAIVARNEALLELNKAQRASKLR